MAITRIGVALGFLLALSSCLAEIDPVEEALALANQVTNEVEGGSLVQKPEKEVKKFVNQADDIEDEVKKAAKEAKDAKPRVKATEVTSDAKNAHKAATMAKEAAKVANQVATHSIKLTKHAKSALGSAQDALQRARVDTQGLTKQQKDSLKEAEKKLREATKDAEYGQVKDAKYVKAEVANKNLKKAEEKMDVIKEKQALDRWGKSHTKKKGEKKVGNDSEELEEMRKELDELRKKLKEKNDDSDDDALRELQQQIEDMEKAEKKDDKSDAKSHDEMKAEIERLRQLIEDLEKTEGESKTAKGKNAKEVERKIPPLASSGDGGDGDSGDSKDAVKVDERSLDIDTAMPYGDLEPFGREDTAQELTEASIRESDAMVDQLERAEVAEEKRAVFRSLTRLRGAAITSFDGVARSQTGNIDEYNKIHQWRGSHPLHHLADEESDVSKWAFPDNAD